jgi:ribosomal-protein-alanine N-acetyltransferase
MSRDLIEFGLGWSWTKSRVIREINSENSNVIVAIEKNKIIGFAVMQYLEKEARLNLFGVHLKHRRKGVGTRMIEWLEKTAIVSGVGVVYLEARTGNQAARNFYKYLGYKEIQQISGYYKGREDAVRIARDLL